MPLPRTSKGQKEGADSPEHHHGILETYTVTPTHHSANTQLNQILAGAISGMCTRTITQPFDVLKIRFQLQVEPVWGSERLSKLNSKYRSLLQACRVIYCEEGIRGFWKGHNAGQFMSIVYGVVQFWSYEQIRVELRAMPFMNKHMNMMNFLSGGLAGCTATFFSMPFDVIRTRLVAQDPGKGYRSTMGAIPAIIAEEGVRGLFRGLGTTLVQIVPMVGFNFMFYKNLNEFARNIMKPTDGHLPTVVLLCTGGMAGVASKAVVYPLDFVKKRLQLQGFENKRQTFGQNQRCLGALHCVELTIRHEGYMGFYKGMYPTLIKSGLTTALYFSIYDKCKHLLNG